MDKIPKKTLSVKGVTRARVFATVIYPESMPENILDLIEDLHIPFFLSPLHHRDINANGEPKKPHYHAMPLFNAPKSLDQVRELLKPLNAVGLEVVSDTRSYARYLCHLDNPDKAQYDPADVKCFGGADYFSTIAAYADKYKAIGEMMEFVDDNDIDAFCDLLSFARDNREEWYRALSDSSSMILDKYIKSRFWKRYKMDFEKSCSGGDHHEI